MRHFLVSVVAVLALLGPACQSDLPGDELAGEDTDEGVDGKADGQGTYTYYLAHGDTRRCASPYCGGMFVDRVNRGTTRCHDGQYQENCYVAEVDFSALNLDDTGLGEAQGAAFAGKLLLRGRIVAKDYGEELGELGVFVASEAWIGRGNGEIDGVFARIDPLHIECFAAPCASATENKLNGSAKAAIAGLDWTPSGASDDQQAEAVAALNDGAGLFVAGSRAWEEGPAGRGKLRSVTQWFTAPAKNPPPPAECVVSGCSSEICGEERMSSICIVRDWYECLSLAVCGRLDDGTCGWYGQGFPECVAEHGGM